MQELDLGYIHIVVDVQVGLYVDPLTIGAEPVCDSLACL